MTMRWARHIPEMPSGATPAITTADLRLTDTTDDIEIDSSNPKRSHMMPADTVSVLRVC
jgi:hypothetical protein